LNAAKSLLTVKRVSFTESHGVAGKFDVASKRSLRNEKITFKQGGIVAALSKYLEEEETETEHTLSDVLANMPFIHRAY